MLWGGLYLPQFIISETFPHKYLNANKECRFII